MRPPICEICGEDIDDDIGGLVSFAMSDSDAEWHDRADDEPGFVGHPPELEWFCKDHIVRAQELSHLTRAEAMRTMSEELAST